MKKIKEIKKARIGLYSVGLKTYWAQFKDLKRRITEYNEFLVEKLSEFGEVVNFGIVDTEEKGREAGEFFNQNNVDIVLSHAGTYYTSACVVPIHQINKAPVVILNLQPTAEMNYAKTHTGDWLLQCVACGIPEIANVFNRTGIEHHIVNGLLGLDKNNEGSVSDEITDKRPEAIEAWKQIEEWVKAASVKRTLAHSNFGFLGGYYSGMLDMYSDLTMLQGQTGMHVEIIEMCDIEKLVAKVTDEQIAEKRKVIEDFFEISEDSPSEPLAKKPTEEQLLWSSKVAVALEELAVNSDLDTLTYYYHGQDQNLYERIQSGFTVGLSLLTARGVACAGEGDIKTALAMKICDILGTGGSYCEIIATDFNRNTIIIGHDGPFHIEISSAKPMLRGMEIYHGKRGSGIAVETKVAKGDVTVLGVTQTIDGKLKLVISEGVATDAPTLENGNTSTHVEFPLAPVEYMDKWFKEAPTHHFALSVGHNASLLIKVAQLMDIPYVTI